MDIEKLPKWARELLAEKDRQIRDLETRVEALRGTVTVNKQVGTIKLRGYGDESLPVDRFFRLELTDGPGAGLTFAQSDERLIVTTLDGSPVSVPVVSNVLALRRDNW